MPSGKLPKAAEPQGPEICLGSGVAPEDEAHFSALEEQRRSGSAAPERELDAAPEGRDLSTAVWKPAHGGNYSVANRPADGQRINKVLIHVTQGEWNGAVGWFATPGANVSAHYTVRSRDGLIAPSLKEKDIGWHAGNWEYNKTSIGIEHEGFVDQP